jgi:hypothetical protein
VRELPQGVNRATIKDTLKKLNSSKEQKKVQKLLRDYTEGEKSKDGDVIFLKNLVRDTEYLNLIDFDRAKPTDLKISLVAILLKQDDSRV